MALWESATVTTTEIGDRIDIDEEGVSFVRILAPSFRYEDVDGEHCFIGHGCQVIYVPEEE